jgi:hypothetical protein
MKQIFIVITFYLTTQTFAQVIEKTKDGSFTFKSNVISSQNKSENIDELLQSVNYLKFNPIDLNLIITGDEVSEMYIIEKKEPYKKSGTFEYYKIKKYKGVDFDILIINKDKTSYSLMLKSEKENRLYIYSKPIKK